QGIGNDISHWLGKTLRPERLKWLSSSRLHGLLEGAMSRFEARGKPNLALSPPVFAGNRFWPRRPRELITPTCRGIAVQLDCCWVVTEHASPVGSKIIHVQQRTELGRLIRIRKLV